MLVEGTTFAAYEVRRRLAVGGMGEVYLCRHRNLDRLDAVKVLRPHLASDVDFRRRFLREALSAARLRHPNVITVYTADEADGLLYLAMEYVAADDLATVLGRFGPLPPHRVLRLLAGVADALDAAHRVHLVHRDIKPSNLLLSDPGGPAERVTLVDFGISRMLDADTDLTATGQIVGTIAYCAPEQLSQGVVGGAADQYALAGVAYECLTGQLPFPRESQLATMTAHLTAPPPSVRWTRPDLPAALDQVLARALAKDPGDRYPTCAAFVADLAAALATPVSDHDEFEREAAAASLPDPDGLVELARSGVDPNPSGYDPTRSGSHPGRRPAPAGRLDLRVGGTDSGVAVVDFARGPYAVRGDPDDTAAFVRWLVAQTVVHHRDRDVCLVAALAPRDAERWLWLNWLPHARPANPPMTGPHLATTPDSATDLLARVGEVVAGRRAQPAAHPLVLALLDGQLGAFRDDPALAGAAHLGVHVVHLLGRGEPVPAEMSTLDLAAGLTAFVCRRPGRPPTYGSPEHVTAAYVRDLTAELPE